MDATEEEKQKLMDKEQVPEAKKAEKKRDGTRCEEKFNHAIKLYLHVPFATHARTVHASPEPSTLPIRCSVHTYVVARCVHVIAG